ncbi:MAG: thioredoxin family protein [Pirellulales bacterium]
MRRAIQLSILVASIAGGSLQATEIQWQSSIDQAQQIAAQSSRLVLVHFWSATCEPCRKLDQNVYDHPGIGPQIEASYVPVKVNAEEQPELRRRYQVQFVPTDVILAPDGKIVAHRACPQDRFEYLAGLVHVASADVANRSSGPQGVVNNPPVSNPLVSNPLVNNPLVSNPLVNNPPGGLAGANKLRAGQLTLAEQQAGPAAGARVADAAAGLGDRYKDLVAPPGQPPVQQPPVRQPLAQQPPVQQPIQPPMDGGRHNEPPVNSDPATNPNPQVPSSEGDSRRISADLPVWPRQPAGTQIGQPAEPPATPPLGLDGTCPVELVDNERWVPGDRRWGAIHRGKLYLFAKPDHQKRFLANPDFYSPALAGNDPVLAIDQKEFVPGNRKHGLFYEKRVFLFSSEETLARFYENPSRYLAAAQPPQVPDRGLGAR